MIKTDPLRRDVYKFATEQDNRFVFYCCTEIITFYLRTETWRKKNFFITFSAKKDLLFTFRTVGKNVTHDCYPGLLFSSLLSSQLNILHKSFLHKSLQRYQVWFFFIDFHGLVFILLCSFFWREKGWTVREIQ